MRIMDRQYTEFPTSGARTLRSVLQDHGYTVNKKRVARLMKVMGLQAIYPKKSLSKLGRAEYIHPYLLRGLHIHKSNQVWSIDITYIAMPKGFMYLVAIIDWYSRKIVAWRLSNSLEASESILCLQEAIQTHGKPDIVNSDQGSQYTCPQWIDYLKAQHIRISMDGRGRAKDNIVIERFWRSIKREYIYLHLPDNGSKLYQGIKYYINYYNERRHHQGIQNDFPAKRYQRSFETNYAA